MLQHVNVRFGLLQETKLMKGIHKRYSAGYIVWKTESEIRHYDRITIVCQEEVGWNIKGATNDGPNAVSFKITPG